MSRSAGCSSRTRRSCRTSRTCSDALRDPETFSSEIDLKLGNVRPMIPQQIDPPAQTRYRRLLDPLFSRKKMAELVPAIRAARDGADRRVRGAGRVRVRLGVRDPAAVHGVPEPVRAAALRSADLPRDQGRHHPPAEVPAAGQLRSREGGGDPRSPRASGCTPTSKTRSRGARANPGDDLLGELLVAEIDGKKLEHNEILDICYLLLIAGLDTVTATLGCNIAYLAANPDQRRRLVENPALIPSAVEELLRWETPVTAVPRVAKRDVTIAGLRDQGGRDRHVPDRRRPTPTTPTSQSAQSVDFDRERNIHVAFGAGPHRCLGSHLARMELQVAMEEWHRRIPDYAIKPGEQPIYSPGHPRGACTCRWSGTRERGEAAARRGEVHRPRALLRARPRRVRRGRRRALRAARERGAARARRSGARGRAELPRRRDRDRGVAVVYHGPAAHAAPQLRSRLDRLWPGPAARGRELHDRGRRAHRPDRPQWRRQVDAAPARGWRGDAGRRRGVATAGAPDLRASRRTCPTTRKRPSTTRSRRGSPTTGRLLAAYHHVSHEVANDPSLLRRMEDLQHEIEACDGWSLGQRVDQILARLELDGEARLARCRAAGNAASRSLVRSSASPTCCCWTSPPTTSTSK